MNTEDRRKWIELQDKHRNCTKTALRKLEQALFLRLYRGDREWFEQNSPKWGMTKSDDIEIDWAIRDKHISNYCHAVVDELLRDEPGCVLTIQMICDRIGKRALFDFKKMPMTKAYLEDVVEARVEDACIVDGESPVMAFDTLKKP